LTAFKCVDVDTFENLLAACMKRAATLSSSNSLVWLPMALAKCGVNAAFGLRGAHTAFAPEKLKAFPHRRPAPRGTVLA